MNPLTSSSRSSTRGSSRQPAVEMRQRAARQATTAGDQFRHDDACLRRESRERGAQGEAHPEPADQDPGPRRVAQALADMGRQDRLRPGGAAAHQLDGADADRVRVVLAHHRIGSRSPGSRWCRFQPMVPRSRPSLGAGEGDDVAGTGARGVGHRGRDVREGANDRRHTLYPFTIEVSPLTAPKGHYGWAIRKARQAPGAIRPGLRERGQGLQPRPGRGSSGPSTAAPTPGADRAGDGERAAGAEPCGRGRRPGTGPRAERRCP